MKASYARYKSECEQGSEEGGAGERRFTDLLGVS